MAQLFHRIMALSIVFCLIGDPAHALSVRPLHGKTGQLANGATFESQAFAMVAAWTRRVLAGQPAFRLREDAAGLGGLMGPGQIKIQKLLRPNVRRKTGTVRFWHRHSPRGTSTLQRLRFLTPEPNPFTAREKVYLKVGAALAAEREKILERAPKLVTFLDQALNWYKIGFKGRVGLLEYHEIFRGLGEARLIAVGKSFEDNEAAWLHEILEVFLAPHAERFLQMLAKDLLSPHGYAWFKRHRAKYTHQGATRHLLIRAITKDALPAADDILGWLIRNNAPYRLSDDVTPPAVTDVRWLTKALTHDEQRFVKAVVETIDQMKTHSIEWLQGYSSLRARKRPLAEYTVERYLEIRENDAAAIDEILNTFFRASLDEDTYARYVTAEDSVFRRLMEKEGALRDIRNMIERGRQPHFRSATVQQTPQTFLVDRTATFLIGNVSYEIYYRGTENEFGIERADDDGSDPLPVNTRIGIGRTQGEYQHLQNDALEKLHFSIRVEPVRRGNVFNLTVTDHSGKGVKVYYLPANRKGAAPGGRALAWLAPLLVPFTAVLWALNDGDIVPDTRDVTFAAVVAISPIRNRRLFLRAA